MSRLTFALLLAGVTGLGAIVQPAWAAKKERVDKKLLARFFEWALQNGDDYNFDKGRANLLGIEPGAPSKAKDFDLNEVTDDEGHSCMIVLQPSKKSKPFCYVLNSIHSEDENRTGYYFKLLSDGTVEDRVMISHGKLKNGEVVRGSGRAEWTTLHAPGIYEKFQHEVDFWLKGMYRKPAAQAAAANSEGGPSLATPASASEVKDAVK